MKTLHSAEGPASRPDPLRGGAAVRVATHPAPVGLLTRLMGRDVRYEVAPYVSTVAAAGAWRPVPADELEHRHEPFDHLHLHVHDEHHQHPHEGWEGPEPHRHPHHHAPVTHRHRFVIDPHHRHWPA